MAIRLHLTREGQWIMEYVFGPVPSRRLGRSLGIDPIPLKTCNWNCVYCQLGRTAPLTGERGNFAPARQIVEEVRRALEAHRSGEVDWVTFVGSGEPTLHERLGWMIRQVKAATDIPVAVITNGSLLYRPEVREELSSADAVLPSLDAGTDSLFRAVNRPHPAFTFKRLVDGLAEFRRNYAGKLWTEVMLVKNLNDGEAALNELVSVLSRVEPDEVHISLPLRPPAEPWVEPADEGGLARAEAILGTAARILPPIPQGVDLSESGDLVDAVIGVISRHPMEEEDLVRTLERWKSGDVCNVLGKLGASGRAQVVTRFGRRFWSAAGARYGGGGMGRKEGPGGGA
ncbi:MAG: radical SAM protein [Bryobacteraceae bacterium]|jgi:wyosine [tRNA(Phe)-imidazoG37] synthetase (radical SAM superfamily)